MKKKVMKLLDRRPGLVECRVCKARHVANIKPGAGRYYRGAWQCVNRCRP